MASRKGFSKGEFIAPHEQQHLHRIEADSA
jgi:hypothetical protein